MYKEFCFLVNRGTIIKDNANPKSQEQPKIITFEAFKQINHLLLKDQIIFGHVYLLFFYI